jgi:hypothetical protein
MANGMIIEGKGIVEWTFSGKENKRLTVKTLCYYVLDCKARLISPQRLFNKDKGVSGKFAVEQTQATLKLDGLSPLEIDYDSRNWLPIATCRNIKWTPSLNLTITNDNNQNLSPAKRRLLNWHYRLGHRNLRDVQLILRSPPFGSEKFLSASRISFEDRPMCEICQYAKAKRKTTHGKTTTVDLQSQGD